MNTKIFEMITLPIDDNGMIANPDISPAAKKYTSGILTIKNHINPDDDDYIAIYGNINVSNNREAIECWVSKQLTIKSHTFLTLLIAFDHHFLDLQLETSDIY